MGWYVGVEFLWGRKIDHFQPHKNCHTSTRPQPLHIPFPCPYLVPGSIAGFAKPNNNLLTCNRNLLASCHEPFIRLGHIEPMYIEAKALNGFQAWNQILICRPLHIFTPNPFNSRQIKFSLKWLCQNLTCFTQTWQTTSDTRHLYALILLILRAKAQRFKQSYILLPCLHVRSGTWRLHEGLKTIPLQRFCRTVIYGIHARALGSVFFWLPPRCAQECKALAWL